MKQIQPQISFDPFQEEELMSFLTNRFGFEVFTPGLERTKSLYTPYKEFFKKMGVKIITIAGTNGKGQTAHTLGGFLGQHDLSFALWTSPHILSIRERFCFGSRGNIEEISYQELREAFSENDHWMKVFFPNLKVSFYEFLFLSFLSIVKKRGSIDYLILEVGLGGRLDAVNHFDADCACITSISRDHQAILGSRLDQILAEKIAVSRGGSTLFTNFSLKYLNEKTYEYTRAEGVLWHPLERVQEDYFKENQKMAWAIFKFLRSDLAENYADALKHIPSYKGRREIMTFKEKSLIFIGAHNIDGVRRMIEGFERSVEKSSEKEIFPAKLLISFSQRPENEIEIMIKSLKEFFEHKATLTFTSFEHPKAMKAEVILEITKKVNKGMLNFVSDWKAELKNSKESSILVCGSYYFIGEVQRYICS